MLSDRSSRERSPRPGFRETAAVWLVVGVTLANVLNGFIECGPDVCPDNPVSYRLLGGNGIGPRIVFAIESDADPMLELVRLRQTGSTVRRMLSHDRSS